MKIPKDDNSFDYDNDEMKAFTREREYEELSRENKPKPNPIVNCIFTCIAYVQFFWIHHRAEVVLGLILFGAVSLAVTGTIEAYEVGKHKTQKKIHSIKHDYSTIESKMELQLGQVDHWCLDGGDKHCPRCEDPTKPVHRMENNGWKHARNVNIKDAKLVKDSNEAIDIVFLGDQNTEARAGRIYGRDGVAVNNNEGNDSEQDIWTGSNLQELLRKSKKKFEKHFKKSEGAKFNGLALGIAGDASPNLLWRLQKNEEMPNLDPKIWWISIGINDLVATSCSEEIALMGILRVVEEILSREDGATIVINSLLPVATRSNLQLEGRHVHNKFWPAVKLVNARLKEFAKNHPGVKFFDAHELLVVQRGNSLYMQKKLFADKFHLSAEGQEVLAEAQALVVESIIAKRAENLDGKSSYRDSSNVDLPLTDFEKKKEEYTSGEDDLYGYPREDWDDQFGIGKN